jgi:Flp pilus assembly protein TadG
MVMLIKDRRAYSLTFWAVFIGLVLIPIFALSIELGRYFHAIAEVQKAADAAALAAAAEFDTQVFQESGDLVPNARAWGIAQTYVNMNTANLSAKGVHAFVSDIQMDSAADTVLVNVSSDLSILFPSVVPKVMVKQIGVAKLRAFTQ